MFGIGESKPVAGHAEDIVSCAASAAYDYVGLRFFENYRKWCPQVIELEELTPPPIGSGSKGRQVTLDRGIESESTFEIAEFAPTRCFAIAGISEPFRSSYEFFEEGDGKTRLVFSFELKELDLVMRPFQKLIRTALQEGAIQTVENIKQLLEGAAVDASQGAGK